MLRPIEADDTVLALPVDLSRPEPVLAAVNEAEDAASFLPQDHPRWVSDAIAISKAARQLVAKLRPVLVVVRSTWDHRLRCIAIAGRRVGIDASGSYRLEM